MFLQSRIGMQRFLGHLKFSTLVLLVVVLLVVILLVVVVVVVDVVVVAAKSGLVPENKEPDEFPVSYGSVSAARD